MIAGLEILNLHAQGGMAEVYRARGKGADGRTWFYAVKRILPEMTQNEHLLEMFIEEARVASLLTHPNIVRVYDLARSEDGDYYIVMEFLEGHDVADIIGEATERGRPLPIWLALHVAREVLQALVYATTQATDREGKLLTLIHRDISPPNIFLCSDGQVKLTDFGVAKVAQSQVLTQVGVTKGKFGYMSPEQLTGEPLDPRSDLYNVGILLYEMITARRLFMADTPSMFLQAMIKAEVPPIDPDLRVPYELEALLRRALSRDRAARPDNAGVFLAELSRVATRSRLVATRANVAEELRALFTEDTNARAAAAAPSTELPTELPTSPTRAPARPPAQAQQQAPEQPPRHPPRRLTSIVDAAPEVVRRTEVPVPAAPRAAVPQVRPPLQAVSEPNFHRAPPQLPAEQPRAPVSGQVSRPVPRPPAPRPPEAPAPTPSAPRQATSSPPLVATGARHAPVRPGTKQVMLLPEDDADPTTLPPERTDAEKPAAREERTHSGSRDRGGRPTVKGSNRVVPLGAPKK